MSLPAYTDDEYAQLRAMWRANVPSPEIADRLGKTVGSVMNRALFLGLGLREIDEWPQSTVSEFQFSERQMHDMDIAFQSAVRAAIKVGQEHPPEGIDRRPGTERPKFIRAASMPSMGSPAAMCMDDGDGIRKW